MDKRCVVVGGGVAGIAAATMLAGRGCSVELLERRPTLGGRAGSYRDRQTGDLVDVGPHLIAGCYRQTLRLLERLGVKEHLALSKRLRSAYVHPGGRVSNFDGGRWPAPLHLVRALLGFDLLSWQSRLRLLRIGPALLSARLRGTQSLRGMVVARWLRETGQDEESIRKFWDPLVYAIMNTSPREAAAEPFVKTVTRLFLGGRTSGAMGMGAAGLGPLFGDGVGPYLEARGGVVRTRAAVRSLDIQEGRVIAAELARGERLEADAFVLAVPPAALLPLLPERYRDRDPFQAARAFQPSPIVSLYLWTDREITSLPFAHLRTRRFEWIFDLRKMMPERTFSGSVYGLVNSAADWLMPLSRQRIVDIARDDLDACFPEAKGVKILHASIAKIRDATFRSVPELEASRPSNETPVDGLFLAGDWTDTGLPGTIESAALSGHRCARAVLRGISR